nr:DUF3813 domain-containing protein [Lederbergia citrea]
MFQQARHFVEQAQEVFSSGGSETEKQRAMEIAKNTLSSAYANTTFAEQSQLREFQQTLDSLK